VYVHPDEPGAPREARGVAGVVEAIEGGQATVAFRGGEGAWTMDVEAHLLRPDRRRRDRTPAQWSGHELAATG
jgi:hypothetical protein